MLDFLPVHILPRGNPSFACEISPQFLLPSKARLCLGFLQAPTAPDPGQMGPFPVCLLCWLWDFSTQFVIQMLDVELQVLFPWPDSKDTAGNMSGILGFWSPIPGTAAKRSGLTRGLFLFRSLNTYLLSPVQIQTCYSLYLLSPLQTLFFHSGSSYA